jgi:TetR/AcrR family acrAB operon transcriptional repressor
MAAKAQGRTQAERREVAEKKLLAAAIKLIVSKGYDRFSLADVGDVAGYSRGLPAHYFGRKEDLLSEVARYLVDSYHQQLTAVPGSERGLPRLIDIVRTYGAGTGTPGNKALHVLVSEAPFHAKLKATVRRLNERGMKTLTSEIEAGVAAGNIRADANVQAQASLIYAFLRGQMGFAALEPGFNVAETTAEFIETLKRNLAPQGSTAKTPKPGAANAKAAATKAKPAAA